jgi:hypothetical protein
VVQEFGHRHIFDVEESDTNQPIHEQVQMRSQEAYQEENTLDREGTVGNIYPEMDLLNIDNEPGSPVSRDLVESIRRDEHTAQDEDAEFEGADNDDDTFLEYHSPDEGNTSEEDNDDD